MTSGVTTGITSCISQLSTQPLFSSTTQHSPGKRCGHVYVSSNYNNRGQGPVLVGKENPKLLVASLLERTGAGHKDMSLHVLVQLRSVSLRVRLIPSAGWVPKQRSIFRKIWKWSITEKVSPNKGWGPGLHRQWKWDETGQGFQWTQKRASSWECHHVSNEHWLMLYGANFDLIHQAPSGLYLQMSSKQKELIPNCLYLQIALLFKSVKQFKRGRKFWHMLPSRNAWRTWRGMKYAPS